MHPRIRRAVGVALLGAALTGCATANSGYDGKPHPHKLHEAATVVVKAALGGIFGYLTYASVKALQGELNHSGYSGFASLDPIQAAAATVGGAALSAGAYIMSRPPDTTVVPEVRTVTRTVLEPDTMLTRRLRESLQGSIHANDYYREENERLREELARKPRVEYRTLEDTVYIRSGFDLPENIFLMRVQGHTFSFPAYTLVCKTDLRWCLTRSSILNDPLRPGNESRPIHP